MVLIGGKNEEEIGDQIAEDVRNNVISLCGKCSINQSASLVKQARLVLANDTGYMHIAAAFGKKILSLWGSTIPEFGMFPYQPHEASKMMEVKGLKCRPCSRLGFDSCPKKHFDCMSKLDVDEISSWIKENY